MTALASGRISAAKTGWIIVLLMAGWALFLFLPFGREEKVDPPRIVVENPGEAELSAVGLGYNVDWIGLPRYFRIWAEQIPWDNDRTEFAMWNPATKTYSYIFEATRTDDRYRFRLLSPSEAGPTLHLVSALAAQDEEAETHPFIFADVKPAASEILYPGPHLVRPEPGNREMTVKVDVAPVKLEPPVKLKPEKLINGTGK